MPLWARLFPSVQPTMPHPLARPACSPERTCSGCWAGWSGRDLNTMVLGYPWALPPHPPRPPAAAMAPAAAGHRKSKCCARRRLGRGLQSGRLGSGGHLAAWAAERTGWQQTAGCREASQPPRFDPPPAAMRAAWAATEMPCSCSCERQPPTCCTALLLQFGSSVPYWRASALRFSSQLLPVV